MRMLRVECILKDDMHKTRDKIHDILKGHEEYINSDIIIVLSTDEERNDGTENEVHVYFLKDDEESKDLYTKIKDTIFC